MDIVDTKKRFRDLEQALLSLVGNGDASNYDLLSFYLDCARRVHVLGEKFDEAVGSMTEAKANSKSRGEQTGSACSKKSSDALSPGSPVYFVFENNLIKVGISSSEASKLYKKVVPIKDVAAICANISNHIQSHGYISSRNLIHEMAFSEYKIQITLMALVAAGAIRQAGRGKYVQSSEYPVPLSEDNFLAMIADMPQRVDLVNAISAQEK